MVAGGGFGGLYAAVYMARSELAGEGARITLVDRKNYFTFTPLLAEVAAGTLLPDHVTYPYRVLGRRYGFHFLRDTVRGVDPDRRLLRTEGTELPYDYLVLAVGATPRFFGDEELRARSLPFTTVHDALAVRNRVVNAVERAAVQTDPGERRRQTTFVIAGAGPAGVELASEVHGLLHEVLPPYYDEIPEGRVVLADGSDRILRGWDKALARRGLERLRERGIEVHLRTRVVEAGPEHVTLSGVEGDERIDARTLIWTAGVSPPEWISSIPLPTEKGSLRVGSTLQVEGRERVFAVGDASILEDSRTGRPYPRVAPIAISQGVRAAGNVENLHFGRALEAYHAHHAGKIVSLGG
ncbi:MAG: FAD-dependent oxidoreductase, partial [Gemmatimonadetes bacterium]|nr:FAD-dependent oxidoreductase [Gemmatimonadota bacterium]NIR80419.1 FAD-dependent oxidoreductase [Gemmatimonadota bacterium]NIT89179.1 FAD-dependent oxidoreductase [Gemmatimonadota bacterium]NIU32979.1 FAD-dependent oxidoreductase [Gemmatimonadota bacterium]NIU37366.1 FAD-dependent oxidoreductase [Gemmatimonadota bacterium]